MGKDVMRDGGCGTGRIYRRDAEAAENSVVNICYCLLSISLRLFSNCRALHVGLGEEVEIWYKQNTPKGIELN